MKSLTIKLKTNGLVLVFLKLIYSLNVQLLVSNIDDWVYLNRRRRTLVLGNHSMFMPTRIKNLNIFGSEDELVNDPFNCLLFCPCMIINIHKGNSRER